MLNFLKKLFSSKLKVKDPVCGMEVSKNVTRFTFEYEGNNYYFCSANCHQMFKNKPEGYVGKYVVLCQKLW